MDLLWPGFLILLGIIPLLVIVYIWILRRKQKYVVRYSSLTLLRDIIPHHSNIRRHIPFALFLLGLCSLIIALSRPVTIISLPTNQTTIMLAIDVSGSMRSRDIQPTRLQAAENAALSFIQSQKATTEIGIVAFSDFAEIIQPPTTNEQDLQSAVDSLMLGRRTAIGSGILTSIDAIASIDHSVAPSVSNPESTPEPTPLPHGVYVPDIIVLLTDGVSNTGPDPLTAAQQAEDRGIRVYTIGFGTPNGYVDPGGGTGGGFGGFGAFGGGRGFFTGIDVTALQQIAAMTGGEYYSASSAGELEKVFQNLPTNLIMKYETSEVSVLFVIGGAVLSMLAIGLSLAWRPLP
jgi:Ca-activated chloride channel family protein